MRHPLVVAMEERLRAKAGKISLPDVIVAVGHPEVTRDPAGYGQLRFIPWESHFMCF